MKFKDISCMVETRKSVSPGKNKYNLFMLSYFPSSSASNSLSSYSSLLSLFSTKNKGKDRNSAMNMSRV